MFSVSICNILINNIADSSCMQKGQHKLMKMFILIDVNQRFMEVFQGVRRGLAEAKVMCNDTLML